VAEVLLSAALIVRDEERLLDGCLRSIAGLVDEVVVVDTGSTDRSREIARERGARVVDFPWCGDFAAARNHGLDLARGAWILYIDADERVSAGERQDLEPLLRDPHLAACTVRFRPITGFTRYREQRLFRNRPDLRFAGVIHETHVPALYDLCVREGLGVAHSSVAIDHLGYDGDLAHKHRRNLPLLRARLARDPTHVYSWCHLGVTLLGMGDAPAAEDAWWQAVSVVRAKTVRSIADSGAYVDLIRSLLLRGEDPTALLDEALGWFPDNFTLQWLRARGLVDREQFAAALPLLERLAATDPEAAAGGILAHDERIFGILAWEALGLCCFRLEDFAASARWYGRAEAVAASPEKRLENRTKRMLAERLAA
jgi:glycosyltransferase involved in cell wall biosynthesis